MISDEDLMCEAMLAGAILIDEGALREVRGLVQPEHFVSEGCRAIFSAALQLYGSGGAVDVVSIRQEAMRMGTDLSIPYLTEIMSACPTAANCREYAVRIVEQTKRRKIKELFNQLSADTSSSVEELMAIVQQEITALREDGGAQGLITPGESFKRLFDAVTAAANGRRNYIATGYPALDDALGGGLIRGGLFILGARPGIGKSALALELADRIEGPVLFVSLEMGEDQLNARRINRVTGISQRRILQGQLDEAEWVKFSTMSAKLTERQVYFNDRLDMTVSRIQMLAQDIQNLQAVIVDYLGLVLPNSPGKSAYDRVTEVSRDLKRLALRLNVPVVALCQLSRASATREDKSPQLTDLRDSGAIEQDADAVFLLHHLEAMPCNGTSLKVDLRLAKNRHGPLATVPFLFTPSRFAFREDYDRLRGGVG